MAKTLGEQLLAVTVQRSHHAGTRSNCCSVCGKPLSGDRTSSDRQVVTESDSSQILVFGLTVLIGLPMLCGGLYLLGSTLADLQTKGNRANPAIVNRCNAPAR
ncbi:hypothetical protein [Chroococcidiopsis thermalis]|uniref:Uncharacterized protein n=1 Tax=Chroococcidiopsis thermalis (strain PCC 7203) TaxID=251229 RepID=K9U2Z8_CHRTP|nr:hypothetical protein [Chroococcidiopsis thermalis]AFY89018.1 hypothetical protein Chro_3563 [Chroococcidiopsis thermalis PCC 7203]